MSNYTRSCVVKEAIEQSATIGGKKISSINLMGKRYNELLDDYTQKYIVVAYYKNTVCGGKIPYVYEVTYFESNASLHFTLLECSDIERWD